MLRSKLVSEFLSSDVQMLMHGCPDKKDKSYNKLWIRIKDWWKRPPELLRLPHYMYMCGVVYAAISWHWIINWNIIRISGFSPLSLQELLFPTIYLQRNNISFASWFPPWLSIIINSNNLSTGANIYWSTIACKFLTCT